MLFTRTLLPCLIRAVVHTGAAHTHLFFWAPAQPLTLAMVADTGGSTCIGSGQIQPRAQGSLRSLAHCIPQVWNLGSAGMQVSRPGREHE